MWIKSRSAVSPNVLVDTLRGIGFTLESDNSSAQVGAGTVVALTPISTGAGSAPTQVCMSADGTSVYAINSTNSTVSIFSRNTTTGVLTGTSTVSTGGTTPQSLCISPDGTSVYATAINYSTGGSITTFARNTTTGALGTGVTTPIGSTTIQPTYGLCISPDGKTVYVLTYYTGPCTAYVFTRNTSTGNLTQASTTTLPASSSPQGICISADGTSAYITYVNSNLLGMFGRNTTTGELTALSTATIATGTQPQNVAISPDGTSVYVTNNAPTGTISIFTRNTTTGTLSGTTTVAGTTHPWGIVVSPDGTNIYFTNNGGASGIYSYVRNTSTGALTGSTYISSSGNSTQGICISADGSGICVANYASNTVTSFTRSLAAVAAVSGTGYTVGPAASVNTNAATYASWAFANDPGAFGMVTYTGNGATTQTVSHSLTAVPALSIIKCVTAVSDWPVTMSTNNLLLDTNAATVVAGSLSGTTTITTGTSSFPYGMCIVPDGTNVYTVNQATNTISIFSRNTATGVLSGSSTFGSTSNAQRITSSPDGKNIYTVSPGTSQINVFNRNTGTGVLTTGTAVSSGSTGKDIVISPDGAFAYVTIQGGTVLTLTRNTSTGALTSGSTISAGSTPTNIIMSADGTSVYVTNNIASGTVSIFTRNTSTGVLTSAGTISTGTSSSPFGLCISPDGSNVYVANNGNNTLSIFTRNTSTGALTSAGTIATQVAPAGVAISPDGLNVYATNNTSGTVSIFTRNTSTGALSGSTTKSAGTIPYAIVISADGSDVYVSNASASTVSTFVRSTSAVPFSTSTTFTVAGAYNVSGQTYIAYLFATLASTSSVGSYTGDGTSSQIINCGFSGGSRFIMVKRTDVAGDWFVWDSTRGINASGNSPHLSWNTTAAEVTTDASVAPSNSGFIVKQVSATNINVNGGTYIYIAFA
jgi:DNA-binding beta-propeller fold protein YncE